MLLSLVAGAVARGRIYAVGPALVAAIVALDLAGGNAGAYVLGRGDPARPPPLAAAVPKGARVLSPFSPREDRWPAEGRVVSTWRWLRRTLGASWNVPLRVGADHDYVGMHEARWAGYREALGSGERLVRLGLFGFSHLVVPGSPELAAKAGVSPPLRVVGSDPELPAWLVEVPHRPRAYLAAAVSTASDREALAFALSGGQGGSTLVEGPLPPGFVPSPGDAELETQLPGETLVRTRAAGPALLVLNDAWAPGWTASVDGVDAPIVRTNALVRGVWLEAGVHVVRFRYRTPGLVPGAALALAGGLALAGWAALRRRRKLIAGDAG